MKKAIQMGAGNIGRGFIGALMAQAGYEVVFADVAAALIDRINQDHGYTVHIMDETCEDIAITGVRGVDSTKPEAVDEIATAALVTTAVGPNILPRIAPTIAKGIESRMAAGCTEPMDVIACENAVRATAQLKKAVYESLSEQGRAFADQYVGFADCAVDRIVPPVRSENPIDVVVERYYEWDVEKGGLKGAPEVPGMTLVDTLDAYIERKLFTLNTGHAITAYLGCLCGCATIDEAIGRDDIRTLVEAAMRESGAGLIRKHGFDPAAHEKYICTILGRFRNPHLRDDVTRVGREPLRKLSASDRLTRPMLTAYGYDLPVGHLLAGMAAALCYDNPQDAQSADLQKLIAAKGVRAAAAEVTGLDNAALLDRITALYDALRAQKDAGAMELAKLDI